MDADEQEEKQGGWWGATLSKLKGALSKTKSALVDSVIDQEETAERPSPGEPPAQPVAAEITSQPVQIAAPQPVATPEALPTPVPDAVHLSPVQSVAPQPAPPQPFSQQIQQEPSAAQPVPQQPVPQQPAPQQPVPQQPAPAPAKPAKPAAPARAIDDDYLEDLEEKLIKADIGLGNVETIVNDLRREARAKNWNSHDVEAFLRREFEVMLASAPSSELKLEPGKLNIVLVVGVNGTGKTTSIGKLCWRLKQQGRKVLLAAGDTFRAAAETQLEIWAERAGVDIVRLPEGADPGAVVYQAIQKATADKYEILIIDTAGRLHNKNNLMAELKKVRSVVDKQAGGAHIESLLVIDASTGQNGLQQAKIFTEFCPLTGVVLTKLDGSAKGGIVFSIARDLKLPVKLIGLGEQIDDLRLFDPRLFVEALF